MTAQYWDHRYASIGSTAVSWYQESPGVSLRLIGDAPLDAAIVDVGGGASRLAGELQWRGHSDITVVDLSGEAISQGLASVDRPEAITTVVTDVRDWQPARTCDVWHDRAAYHFLTDPADQAAYWATVRQHLAPGGRVVIATFAEDGPEMCSGLPVTRYSPAELEAAMGEGFAVTHTERQVHVTPTGGEQRFIWLVAERTA